MPPTATSPTTCAETLPTSTSPRALTDTVTFKATDAAHNSASIKGMIPPGADEWNGKLSQDISITFNVEGLYGYQCTPHMMMAMVGIIEVGENQSNLETFKTVAQKIKSAFVMNQERLDEYLSQL